MVLDLVATSPDDYTLVLHWDAPAFFDEDVLSYISSALPMVSFYIESIPGRNRTIEIQMENTMLIATKLRKFGCKLYYFWGVRHKTKLKM